MDKNALQEKIEAMSRGDEAAFEDIYKELSTPVFTIILRIVKDRSSAENIMQELFLRLWQGRERFSARDGRCYILASARNMAIDELRRKKPQELDPDTPDPSVFEAAVAGKLDIASAMSSLPLCQREALVLHINCGLKFREIAEITKTPIGTVIYRYNTAVKKLKRLL